MTFPTTAELEEEEMEIVTADIMKAVDEDAVVITTTQAMITPEEVTTETTQEKEDIADTNILTSTVSST